MTKRIAVVVFSDPFDLPPTVHAARILAEHGWAVDVLGVRWKAQAGFANHLPANVNVQLSRTIGRRGSYLRGYAEFALRAVRHARRTRPDWIYAYDMMAAPVGHAMARLANARLAYHCHDTARPEELGRLQRWLQVKPLELAAARAADLVVFPQRERAEDFARDARLSEIPLVAYNCPLRAWGSAASEDPETAAHRRRWPRLVLYQGGINEARGVGALIDSLPGWPGDSGLVLVGDATGKAGTELKERAVRRGVAERILWRRLPSYEDLPSVGRCAALGVLITPFTDYNLERLAGASNKIFEYMACGLPVLAPHTRGFRELIEAPGHGEVCTDWTPEALARQIGGLLNDEPRRRAIGVRNRAAFEQEFHYEKQFARVLAALETEAGSTERMGRVA